MWYCQKYLYHQSSPLLQLFFEPTGYIKRMRLGKCKEGSLWLTSLSSVCVLLFVFTLAFMVQLYMQLQYKLTYDLSPDTVKCGCCQLLFSW